MKRTATGVYQFKALGYTFNYLGYITWWSWALPLDVFFYSNEGGTTVGISVGPANFEMTWYK